MTKQSLVGNLVEFAQNIPEARFGVVVGKDWNESGGRYNGYFGATKTEALQNFQVRSSRGFTVDHTHFPLGKQTIIHPVELDIHEFEKLRFDTRQVWNRCYFIEGYYPALRPCGDSIYAWEKGEFGSRGLCKSHSNWSHMTEDERRSSMHAGADRIEAGADL